MALFKDEIVILYRKRAKHYDFTANLYYLMGFREQAYRRKAVRKLNLNNGDTVVEIGCGTGLNFPMLQEAVGPKGKIVGVDLTDAMLDQACQRIKKNNWMNVELVQGDAAAYRFPDGTDGIISTFAITLCPEFDRVIQNGCYALKTGKRWVILDFKMTSGWLAHLAPLAIMITMPFGVTADLASRHPWESIKKYLKDTSLAEFYMGFVYIATGERGEEGCNPCQGA